MASPPRTFLLSPASLAGIRGRRLLDGSAGAPFTAHLHRGGTVALEEVYTFISSLYFRGKLRYARAFSDSGPGPPAWIITSCRGLVPVGTEVGLADLRELARSDIDPGNPAYVDPLVADARRLAPTAAGAEEVVLLGSLATDKYLGPLLPVLGPRLRVPATFVGRGDMSRGGLLLRAADAGRELDYIEAASAPRRGPRPPRLPPA